MPRKSGEARAIARFAPPTDVNIVERPEAPPDLNRDQAEEWITIVNRMPADWFGPECHALLASLCRHIVYSREVAGELEAINDGLEDYERGILRDHPDITPSQLQALVEIRMNRRGELARTFNMHTQSIAMLATKLRLTPQSKVHPATL